MSHHPRLGPGRRNDEGASAVEYGLLVTAIAAVIVIVVMTLGDNVRGTFQHTCSALSSGSSVAC